MQRTIQLTILGSILLLSSSTVSAKHHFKQCYDKAMTTIAIGDCVNKEFAHYDQVLNQHYKKLMSKLNKNGKQKLIIAQRAWLDFLNKDCEFSGVISEGGSMQSIEIGQCKIAHTKKRVRELNGYIKE